jgi:hypothetical protein
MLEPLMVISRIRMLPVALTCSPLVVRLLPSPLAGSAAQDHHP